jgi:hypothetical protein
MYICANLKQTNHNMKLYETPLSLVTGV